MSPARIVLRVFLAGAVLKMLLLRQTESGDHPGLRNAILTFDPIATALANGSQQFNLIHALVFGLECVLLFFAIRWFLSRRKTA